MRLLQLERAQGGGRALGVRLLWIGVWLAPLLAAALLPAPDPSRLVFCALRRMTGIPCLTCGFSRAFSRAVHGQWLDALRDCPLGVVPPLILIFALSCQLANLLLGVTIVPSRPPLSRRRTACLLAALALLAAANWTYRLARGCA